MAFVGVSGWGSTKFCGVGYLILLLRPCSTSTRVFAGILVLTACALALDGLVSVAEKRLLVWRPALGVETEPS